MDEGLTAEEEETINDMPSRMEGFEKERSRLIPILQMIQDVLGYLPSQAIAIVADYLDLTERCLWSGNFL